MATRDAFTKAKGKSVTIADNGYRSGKVSEQLVRGRDFYKQQQTASPEEQERRKAALKTQGRKGCKLTRINFAISPDHLAYLKALSSGTGMNMTVMLNTMIAEHMEKHPSIWQKAKELLDEMQGVKVK